MKLIFSTIGTISTIGVAWSFLNVHSQINICDGLLATLNKCYQKVMEYDAIIESDDYYAQVYLKGKCIHDYSKYESCKEMNPSYYSLPYISCAVVFSIVTLWSAKKYFAR